MTEDQLPALFNYDAAQDFEDMEQEDFLTPRLKVAQSQTPEAQDGTVNNGDIFCAATSEVIVPRNSAKTIIPLAWWKEWLEWNPNRQDKKERIIARSTDVHGDLARACNRRETVINSDGKKVPRVQSTYNVLLLVPEVSWSDMYMMSFARTHYKVWKRLLNLAKGLKHDPDGQGKRPCPLFGAGYEISTSLEDDGTNRWFEPRFGPPEFLGVEHLREIQPIVEKLRENIEQMKEANGSEEDTESVNSSNAGVDESAMDSI